MSKRIIISCLFILIAHIAFAQISSESPFKKLHFINSPTDTVTLVASYTGIIDSLTSNNQSIISTIKKHGGKPVKNVTYTVNIQLPGYQKKLAIACADQSMLSTLKNNVGVNAQIIIKCLVYRFYFLDGVCNFFYIAKVDQIGKRLYSFRKLVDNG